MVKTAKVGNVVFRKILVIAFFTISFACNNVNAQHNIGVDNSYQAGNHSSTVDESNPSSWVGKRFTFLELKKFDQNLDYLYLHFSKDFTSNKHPEYKDYVGKKLRVLDVQRGAGSKMDEYIITFEEEKSKIKLYAQTHQNCVVGIAPTEDLDFAKFRWLGKTIYAKKRWISTYDARAGTTTNIDIPAGTPLKVADVRWGDSSQFPIWLIVETPQGQKGYVFTSVSWTNSYPSWRKSTAPWSDYLFDSDPRTLYPWGEDTWSLITAGKLKVGMNKDQVALSWGEPSSINKSTTRAGQHEQWVYKRYNAYLYFDNGVLATIQQ
jgi:hypothetical protein